MHPALFQLILLLNKAAIRRALRGARTVRGALLLLFSLGFIALMIVPQILSAIAMNSQPQHLRFADTAESFASLGLLALALLSIFSSAGEKALYFTPAEVDLLFPAPFSRRALLIYKLGKTAIGLVVMPLIFSVCMLIYFRSWLCAFVGLILTFAMLQLLGMATAMVSQIVAESIYTRVRKIVLTVVLILLFLGFGQVAGRVQGLGIRELVAGLRASTALRVLVAPFEVYTRAIFAEAWFPDLLAWGAGALAIDLGLLFLILKLDANYLESAAAISQKLYERLRRARVGGGVAMPASARAGRFRLPLPPRLAGAGPIAWRQILLAIRTSRHFLIIILILGGFVVAGELFVPTGPNGPGAVAVPVMGVAMTMYLTLLFTIQLPWAFRGDVDHIDFLKTLPIHPMILTVGELAGGALLLTLAQLFLFVLFTAAAPAGAAVTLVTAAFLAPFNAMLLSLTNLIFLIYPVRAPVAGTFDFQVMGKWMFFFFLQMAMLLLLLGIPAALGGLAYLVSGYSLAAFGVTTWLMLAAELPPLVMLVAWAFQRFDPSTETPA
jgi:ABC-2 type transport system permease protein